MAQITLDRSANTLAGYFGSGYTTASSVTDSAIDGGTLVINTALLRNYIGDAADTTNSSMTELLYSVLRRVEDTYNGTVGTMVASSHTIPASVSGTKPTNFSISRVETTDKAIFTVAIPLTKTTTVEGGSL